MAFLASRTRRPTCRGHFLGNAVNEDHDLWHVGVLLRERRLRAKLSRAKLAERTKLSEGTIKNLEAGRHKPNHQTLAQLLAIKELALEARDLLPPGQAGERLCPALNALLLPEADALTLTAQLRNLLAGPSVAIPPKFFYLDVPSAEAWMRLALHPAHPAARIPLCLREAAQLIRKRMRADELDLVALGPGDARREMVLLDELLRSDLHPSIVLYLIDSSPPLLSLAYKRVSELLPPWMRVYAVQGDIDALPGFGRIFSRHYGSARQRLVTLLGGTFDELTHEMKFVESSLSSCASGDLLLLQFTKSFALQWEGLHQVDPALLGTMPEDLFLQEREWLVGALARHIAPGKGPVPAVKVELALDHASCLVPGSYSVDRVVVVGGPEEAKKRFTVTYQKRYEVAALTSCLAARGWERLQFWEETGNQVVGVFERR